MKKSSISMLILACSLAPLAAQAFGNQTTWTSGWGQGVSEFVIKGKGQSQLYLACEDTGSSPATIIFTDAAGHEVSMDSEKTLELRIDGGTAIDVSDSDSRVGENNLTAAWDALRTGKKVTASGDGVKPVTFTLNGAGQVLPKFGTHGCVSKSSI